MRGSSGVHTIISTRADHGEAQFTEPGLFGPDPQNAWRPRPRRWPRVVFMAGLAALLAAGAIWLTDDGPADDLAAVPAGEPATAAADPTVRVAAPAAAPETTPRLARRGDPTGATAPAADPGAARPDAAAPGDEPHLGGWPVDIAYPEIALPEEHTVRVGRGDTLMGVLTEAGASREEAHAAIQAVSEVFDPRRLRAGQDLTIAFGPGGAEDSPLLGMRFDTDVDRFVEVALADGGFAASEIERELTPELRGAEGTIESSLYVAGAEAGIPPAVLVNLIRVYSFSVDFQRDIRAGDTFEVMYEDHVDEDGNVVRQSDILYASLTVRGTTERLWRFEPSSGDVDYFDEKGESVRRMLMRTPIDGARLSSRFGMRRHPILGYSRMHQGVDFAAPRGTPIYAAGNGVVDYAGRKGGYGNYIRIRHNGTYSTAYAHMKGFARGVRKGTRVRQGQTIGYVGSTGASTGPHLHYEVHYQGKQTNPMALKLPSGEKLKGQDLENFQVARAETERRFAELAKEVEVAATANDRGERADACTEDTRAEETPDAGC